MNNNNFLPTPVYRSPPAPYSPRPAWQLLTPPLCDVSECQVLFIGTEGSQRYLESTQSEENKQSMNHLQRYESSLMDLGKDN